MDVDAGTLNVNLSDDEIQRRLQAMSFAPKEEFKRGFIRHYIDSVQQADLGCNFDYLQ